MTGKAGELVDVVQRRKVGISVFRRPGGQVTRLEDEEQVQAVPARCVVYSSVV